MKTTICEQLAARKREVENRLDKTELGDCSKPMFTASNIHYEIAERVHGITFGGIGAIHMLAQRIGHMDAIDKRLHILKMHLPYCESDHVINIAYNAVCNGDCLQDIELRRNDVNFLDALGARRIPDPTTAGDFCRRFQPYHINVLQDIFDDVRIDVWKQQPDQFFNQAILDADGTLVPTAGKCKEGVDIAYNGTWSYHPLLISFANTKEVMRIVNRPGNPPSHEGAADALDSAAAACFRAGFRTVYRGDTDFSQTKRLDNWDADSRIRFIFGFDAKANVIDMAEKLPEIAWKKLHRRQPPEPATGPGKRAPNVKDTVVRAREFETLLLQSEPAWRGT